MRTPTERGRMILEPREKRGHCSACEPTPSGRVGASELWERMRARSGNGFVRILK